MPYYTITLQHTYWVCADNEADAVGDLDRADYIEETVIEVEPDDDSEHKPLVI